MQPGRLALLGACRGGTGSFGRAGKGESHASGETGVDAWGAPSRRRLAPPSPCPRRTPSLCSSLAFPLTRACAAARTSVSLCPSAPWADRIPWSAPVGGPLRTEDSNKPSAIHSPLTFVTYPAENVGCFSTGCRAGPRGPLGQQEAGPVGGFAARLPCAQRCHFEMGQHPGGQRARGLAQTDLG